MTISTNTVEHRPVDRHRPWQITGTAYSAARITVADLADKLTDTPDHLPVSLGVPDWDCRDFAPLRSTVWDGALVLKTSPAETDPNTLDLDLPAPVPTDGGKAPADGSEERGALTVGDLAAILAALPDHAPVMVLVPGWNGDTELVLDYVAEHSTCLVLDTDYPACDPYADHD
ncbi:hypothetical protein GCM10010441_44780 [Kitasatospora paracochleata]|uniref:Uncharacterized protein n=1 Tax=Kitasatospora paracochleata TaxID=58354 RepID=A0ABT1J9C9_9ACTN|nr:hypothetical protein [Kitasatospora paracochleata]MCP2314055.1 hypothetical protein [Kitasatospora paracochleata]